MVRILTPLWQLLKRHKKKSIAGVLLLALAGFGISSAMRPAKPEYVTAVAEKSDLRQTVEAVGTVVSERELELRFGASGIVSGVSVKEGDRVTAGQMLAQLKAGSLGASIASQAAALQSAQADLRAMEEGSRPEDIAIAEADVQNKRASLESARQTLASSEENITKSRQQLDLIRQEANVSLSGQVTTSMNTLNEQLTTIENSLSTIDDILSRTDVNDAMIKSQPNAPGEIRAQHQRAISAISSARTMASSVSDYAAAGKALTNARDAASQAGIAMDTLFRIVSSLQETAYFTASARESVKASIASERSSIQDAAGTISSTLSSLQNAAASFDTKIASQSSSVVSLEGTRDRAKADILTYEAAVRSAEAQLALKRAGARQTDVDSARARVRQAQANLARSQADFGETILRAPVSGTITHVTVRIGESTPTGAAITLLGESPYRVEMFVSEIDIPKVQLTQSGSIELDAFRGTNFALRVGDIDPSSTDTEGVPKYRVRLDFVHKHDEFKIGMTGDAAIVTGSRDDVIHVPVRSVLDNPSGTGKIVRILKEDGEIEERPVTTGMEGEGGDIEILTGVEEGEVVVVLIKQ